MNKVSLAALAALLLSSQAVQADDKDDQFIHQVYAQGGQTLYCQQAFKAGDRVSVEHIYTERDLRHHFGCHTSRSCKSNPDYLRISQDRHNMYPVTLQSDLDRRRTQFGDLPGVQNDSRCGYKLSFQSFEPPDSAKGNVARAMLYMYHKYKLPLIGTLQMYQRWNRLDPVDDAERHRNDVIEKLQGDRNPFIDDPEQVNTLKSQSPLNLQFP
ncbi:MAG: endonuclease [Alcanivorax sp.]|nr:endonuclease [Alcanivorax sp.]